MTSFLHVLILANVDQRVLLQGLFIATFIYAANVVEISLQEAQRNDIYSLVECPLLSVVYEY